MAKKVIFAAERCKGCELCAAACPKGLIALAEHINSMGFHPAAVEDQGKCISCGNCYRMCPDQVICIRKEEK